MKDEGSRCVGGREQAFIMEDTEGAGRRKKQSRREAVRRWGALEGERGWSSPPAHPQKKRALARLHEPSEHCQDEIHRKRAWSSTPFAPRPPQLLGAGGVELEFSLRQKGRSHDLTIKTFHCQPSPTHQPNYSVTLCRGWYFHYFILAAGIWRAGSSLLTCSRGERVCTILLMCRRGEVAGRDA